MSKQDRQNRLSNTYCVLVYLHLKHRHDRKHIKNVVFSYFFVPVNGLKTTLPFLKCPQVTI